MQHLIYVTEDEENIRELIRCTLESYGWQVQGFEDGAAMLSAVKEKLPSLILLDIMMPGIDGITALKLLKGDTATASVPVILISAKSEEFDKATGLDLGADDYITKPFGLLELTARVRAALRRKKSDNGENAPVVLHGGDLTIDLDSREVTKNDEKIELTYKEFELLKLLVQNSKRAVTREELLNEIWGYDYMGETRTLDMHIKTLRSKVGDDAENPHYIRTIRGVGYKFIG